MKVIRIEITGMKFRIFENDVEVKYIKQFLFKGGLDYAPTMELEQYLVDECDK